MNNFFGQLSSHKYTKWTSLIQVKWKSSEMEMIFLWQEASFQRLKACFLVFGCKSVASWRQQLKAFLFFFLSWKAGGSANLKAQSLLTFPLTYLYHGPHPHVFKSQITKRTVWIYYCSSSSFFGSSKSKLKLKIWN